MKGENMSLQNGKNQAPRFADLIGCLGEEEIERRYNALFVKESQEYMAEKRKKQAVLSVADSDLEAAFFRDGDRMHDPEFWIELEEKDKMYDIYADSRREFARQKLRRETWGHTLNELYRAMTGRSFEQYFDSVTNYAQ